MLDSSKKGIASLALVLTLALAMLVTPAPRINAADHGDGPTANLDKTADIGDLYVFLDPNDNSRLILLATLQGFINPGEALNFGAFDQNVRYRFDIETTGDAREDLLFDIRFTARATAANQVQTATIVSPFGEIFTAPTTPGSFADTPPAPVVTTDPRTGISFFAGLVDDPFFFDIPAFGRFVSSVLAGTPNTSFLQRGRDSFAGFNNLGIALSMPVSYLRLFPGQSEIGVAFRTQRRFRQFVNRDGTVTGDGRFSNVDRMGNPAVNVALTPFPIKDQYNAASPLDDSQFRFANDIIGLLTRLGTSQANINTLAQIAVVRGDILRLNINTSNTGPGGGNNAGAGFPNGRRLSDDVIDIELNIITNGAVTTGDNVNGNEKVFRNTFPFFAPSHTPLPTGTTDDATRH
ncbi:MAG TPA: DUF4331 family protein [Blastocatellia bacterium]|nr:DUF4331 family protein [Blastocatellia bacterium]